jgi:hypothetical protein
MKTFTTLALAAALTTAFAGASFAQTMSDSDKMAMTKCQGMSETAMKADANCMAMMKKYPNAAKDGMASPGSSNANPTPKSK